jgi:hypothetical protein
MSRQHLHRLLKPYRDGGLDALRPLARLDHQAPAGELVGTSGPDVDDEQVGIGPQQVLDGGLTGQGADLTVAGLEDLTSARDRRGPGRAAPPPDRSQWCRLNAETARSNSGVPSAEGLMTPNRSRPMVMAARISRR